MTKKAEIILEFMKDPEYKPMKAKEIAIILGVPKKEYPQFQETIAELEKEFKIGKNHKNRYRVIEEDRILEKSSDDGEPSGTAGGPMLNILQKSNLCNVIVVVTRYFGGILLGTGGLVRAYSEATQKSIEKSEKIEMILGIEMEAKVEYSEYEKFKYYCQKNQIKIEKSNYSEKIICKIALENNKKDQIIKDYKTKKINLEELTEINKKIIEKSIIK